MPRSLWNGTIAFGMVRVPVKLYSATESKAVSFRERHSSDGAAIAALSGQGRPDPSNREIANHAGISDPGQISKLLARLEKHELVHNSGDDQSKGERNAWTLTTKGEEVERATRAREGG